MNNVEAVRIIQVLDETLQGLQWMSYVTWELLDSATELGEVLGQDVASALEHHRSLVEQEQVPSNEAVQRSSLDVWAALAKAPLAGTRLRALQVERASPMLNLLNVMERVRAVVVKKLSTTVEDDVSAREYYEEVRDREEKALADRASLEQQLKLERIERQKQLRAVTLEEGQGRMQLEDLQGVKRRPCQSRYTRFLTNLTDHSRRQREGANEEYVAGSTNLQTQLDKAVQDMEALRGQHGDTEAQLRSSKKKAGGELEAALQVYDTELGAKDAQLQEHTKTYNDLVAKVKAAEDRAAKLRSHREELEAKEEAELSEWRQKNAQVVESNHAARVIQRHWRAYIASKKPKKGKKGKGKKKK